ncbi:MAG TPA: trypsin-like peptidase domain-containing protein [Miltoncostaeaceae bacterium]|nr:trypsin-like peptidase domain-containing protein [Miltoncostaeaceae bacterium]
MPPPGPDRNPYPPQRRRRRAPAWLTGGLLPAVVGGLVVLGGLAVTGNLGGDETVVRSDPTPLPPATRDTAGTAAEGEGEGGGAATPARGVQRVVAASSPAVVTVTVGNASAGGRLGSGFVVDRRGRVLTNAHVVDDAKEAQVRFDDGTETDARVLGADESTDLAVLQVERTAAGVTPLPLGRSGALSVGDAVIAIGNPFGLERTATTGIVSALKRIITAPNGFDIQNVIQTDAAINEGNSGGPLLDAAGHVIGINSQIASEGGGNNGVGFAVPIDTIRPVADSIIADGTAEHAWLGVTGRSVTPDIATALGLGDDRGVAIVETDDRGPAAKAGLRAATTPLEADVPRGGDVIVAVDGGAVRDMADVSRAVSSRAVGEALAVTVVRDGGRRTIRVTLADRPADVGVNPAAP